MLVEALQRRYGEEIDDVASVAIGVALVIAAAGLLAKTLVLGHTGDDAPYLLTRRDRVLALSIGIVGGFVLGLTSVGSGTFFGLLLIMLFPLTAAKVVGTDIFHAAILLWAAGFAHLAGGNVDLAATGLAGSRLDPGRARWQSAHRSLAGHGDSGRARNRAVRLGAEAGRRLLGDMCA